MASVECSEDTEECTRRVFEAVSNNSVSLFRDARYRYGTIKLLTSLAECNEEGETPLAIAIKRDYFSVVEEIKIFLIFVLELYHRVVENPKTHINESYYHDVVENQPKLKYVIDQLLHQFPIKALIDNLIFDQCRIQENIKWLMFIAKIVIESISLTRQDKIILLEVIGTALIIQLNRYEITEEKALCGNYGLECWREAMTLRYFPTDGGPLLPKLPHVHVPSSVLSSVISGSAVEVATIEELDLLQQDFQRNYLDDRLPCVERMVIQALLVSRRFSDQEHLGHPHWLYLQSLLDFASIWGFQDNIGITTYLFILEELNGFDPNLLPIRSFYVVIETLFELSDKFVQQLSEPPNSPEGRELNYANLLILTKWITTIQCNHPHFQNFGGCQRRGSYVVFCLVLILNSFSSRITSEERQKLEKFFYDYFRADFHFTTTVLHDAVSYYISRLSDVPNKDHAHLQTIKQILKFGADPNAIDENGQTPLHRLAERTHFTDMDESVPLFQVLLDAGAHLDAAGDNGRTVVSILKDNLKYRRGFNLFLVHPYFESLFNSVVPLSCFCARVIRRHGIPFEDRLPPRLKKLVSIHSAEGKQIINHSAFLAK